MSAFPPHRLGASVPVNQEIALKFLSKYLEAAKTSPHLLPNAKLDPSGPTAGSSSSSVTIHNLQRVEAGLKGEWLAPTLDLEENNVPMAEGMDDGVNQGQGAQSGGEDGWMDLDDYQRAQSVDGGEIEEGGAQLARNGEDSDLEDEREHKGRDGEDEKVAPGVKTPKKKFDGVAKSPAAKPLDKAARAKAKKLRLKEEQRLKEQAKQKKSTAT
jgi:hypothetical protein